MEKAYLVLENGAIFEGRSFGAAADTVGELVFTTAMCGYTETLTDPSYYGQIVLQTYPLIGNYGVMDEDFEGACCVKGYVVREVCEDPSNFRMDGTLTSLLKKNNIPAICGVDTRELTRIIRECGVLNAAICREVPKDLSIIHNYCINNAAVSVCCKNAQSFDAVGAEEHHVALLDFGAKRNIVRELTSRGCRVTVYPCSATCDEVLSSRPNGIMLSNGPGDPAENVAAIAEIAKMLGKVPIFGICLGHQLTALAVGGKTYKMKYGHRGVNQPVRDLAGDRTFITTQNHGYAVDASTVAGGVELYRNANDGSCEGIDYPSLRAFTVQFHPEACGGPKDTEFLFDRFLQMMEGK